MSSLRTRLIFSSTLILLVFGALTFLALRRAFYSSALDAQEEKMKGFIYSLLGSIDFDSKGQLQVSEFSLQEQRLLSPQSGMMASVLADNGNVLWKSPSSSRLDLLPSSDIETGQWFFLPNLRQGSAPMFLLGFGVTWIEEKEKSQKFTIYLAEDKKDFNRQLHIYYRTLRQWLLLIAVGLIGGLVVVLRWGLSPLGRVTRELDRIRAGKQEAIGRKYPAELVPLTEGLNALLRHERGQQKRYMHALDDLAHSLKTPLAVLRGMADRRMSDQIEQIDKILDYQVRRASTAGRKLFVQPMEVRGVVDRIVSSLSKVYGSKGVSFSVDIDPSVRLPMEEGDLMEIFGNLLDNACKWCRKSVTVNCTREDRGFTFVVEDDGEGFPEGERERLLERGVRADRRVSGQGIGLSVVQSLVALYEGMIELESGEKGGGRVTLKIPV